MHTVENMTGRLIEVRVATPLTLQEVGQFRDELAAAIRRIPTSYVGVVDLLRADVFPTEVAQAMIELLSGTAALVERTAFYIGNGAVFAMQIERVLRNSNNPQRKSFRDPAELQAWLDEVLNPYEQKRLTTFLASAHADR